MLAIDYLSSRPDSELVSVIWVPRYICVSTSTTGQQEISRWKKLCNTGMASILILFAICIVAIPPGCSLARVEPAARTLSVWSLTIRSYCGT